MINVSRNRKRPRNILEIGSFEEIRDDDEFVEETDDEEIGEEDINVRKPPLHPNRKPSTRKPSPVWAHFTKDVIFNFHKCNCNYCGQQFACDPKSNGTSHLNYHVKTSCKSIPRGSDKRQKTLAFGTNSDSEGSSTLIAWSFNKEKYRNALARMIIIDELPFNFVEGEGFLQFCHELCPSFDVPSRRTICRDVLQLYWDSMDSLKKVFSTSLHGVCLTTDTWTSIQNVNYMVLTAHFVDGDWKLHKRIINFCVITSHKGENIEKLIVQCIKKWELKRIVSITVDNASANEVAINYVKSKLIDYNGGCVLNGEFMHIRCCAHITNLIVNDGLKEISSTIAGIRTTVKFVRSSPSRLSKFRETCSNLEIENKSMLVLDVPTKWNSTYMMLEAALKYKRVFDDMKENDGIFVAYFDDGIRPPGSVDWKNAELFVKFLKYFYDLTLKFSKTLSITANVCFPTLSEIEEELRALIGQANHFLANMAISMKAKFDKYWGSIGNMNKILLATCVLDSRYKFQFLKLCVEDMYDKKVAKAILKNVKNILVRLFSFYANDFTFGTQMSDEPQPSTTVDVESVENVGNILSRKMNIFHQQVRQQDNEGNELEKYLNAPIEVAPNDYDVLLWWKVNSSKYRVLSLVARDLLAIPVSTVASESAFSTGGRVIDPFRSTLSPRMVEALVCTQNWLRSNRIFIDHRIEVPFDDVSFYDEVLSDFIHGRQLESPSPSTVDSPYSSMNSPSPRVGLDLENGQNGLGDSPFTSFCISVTVYHFYQ